MASRGMIGVIALLILAVVVSSSVFTIDEREKALVFRFGEIIRSTDNPGLHFKWPIFNSVKKYDARIQTMDAAPESYLTVEKKNLQVDSFVKWRIDNVKRYYTSVGGQKANAENRLRQKVNDSLRREFGNRSVQDVISGDRATIMTLVQKATNEEAQGLGVEVVDVRLKRVDLDPSISDRVYRRMEAERSRVAKELRAQGAEAAEKIRADADRQREILIAESVKQAEKLRGEGDAGATNIYAAAFDRDREFYNLYRSLNAYKTTFGSKDDIIVLEPDSEFFRYFKQRDAKSADDSK